MKLSTADRRAIRNGDHIFLLDKGAKHYTEQNYPTAVEYYRLAASLGNMQAVSNLGYCYMYGRGIERDIDLAIAYFEISAEAGIVDSLQKLGNLYEHGNYVDKDSEMAVYYYLKAITAIEVHYLDITDYPSLYFSLAKACLPGGVLSPDLEDAYLFLRVAKEGYEKRVNEGFEPWKKPLKQVNKMLEDPLFETMRERYPDVVVIDDDWNLEPLDEEELEN